jgi:homoserine dehydrogenase
LVGVGHVGRAFLQLLDEKAELLRTRHDLELVLTGACDSTGAVLAPAGIAPLALREHKLAGHGVASSDGGAAGMTAQEMAATVEADVLLEASPVSMANGQPGLDCVRLALGRGISAVLANKGAGARVFRVDEHR